MHLVPYSTLCVFVCVCVCVCVCSNSESDSPRSSNTVLVENREGEILLTAELDTKIIRLFAHYLWQSVDMTTGFIDLNSPCLFPRPFGVPSEFFKLEWVPLSSKSGKCCLSQAPSLWLDNRIPTPLIHITTEGDPQPNHPTPASCSAVLEKLTFAKLLNMSPIGYPQQPVTGQYAEYLHTFLSLALDHLARLLSQLIPCLWVCD